MQVILLERVEKLGQMGDDVKVKDGFARNFLLPKKKALRATKANAHSSKRSASQLETHNLERKAEAEKIGQEARAASTSRCCARQATAASFTARYRRATSPISSPTAASPSTARRCRWTRRSRRSACSRWQSCCIRKCA